VLDKPQVAGAIVGARLGVAEHIADTQRIFDLRLDATDLDSIHTVTAQARDLNAMIGDCGAEYRN
jgi:hypothetical protein